ncbi:hypothetical protein [Planctomycetes bacterium Pan216]|uniref:hypothetical protein n=1 Tax=Kolteria novifilia TaxID=2527975 RepID=UPI00119FB2F0
MILFIVGATIAAAALFKGMLCLVSTHDDDGRDDFAPARAPQAERAVVHGLPPAPSTPPAPSPESLPQVFVRLAATSLGIGLGVVGVLVVSVLPLILLGIGAPLFIGIAPLAIAIATGVYLFKRFTGEPIRHEQGPHAHEDSFANGPHRLRRDRRPSSWAAPIMTTLGILLAIFLVGGYFTVSVRRSEPGRDHRAEAASSTTRRPSQQTPPDRPAEVAPAAAVDVDSSGNITLSQKSSSVKRLDREASVTAGPAAFPASAAAASSEETAPADAEAGYFESTSDDKAALRALRRPPKQFKRIDPAEEGHHVVIDPDNRLLMFHTGVSTYLVEADPRADLDEADLQQLRRVAKLVASAVSLETGTRTGTWTPSLEWIAKDIVTKRQVTDTPSKGIALKEVTLVADISQNRIEQAHETFLRYRNRIRTLHLAETYLGAIMILGGAAIFLRFGTGRRLVDVG